MSNDKIQPAITKLENLPNEILLQTMQYLNATDVINSFTNLNNRFDSLIQSLEKGVTVEQLENIVDEICQTQLQSSKLQTEQTKFLFLPKKICIKLPGIADTINGMDRIQKAINKINDYYISSDTTIKIETMGRCLTGTNCHNSLIDDHSLKMMEITNEVLAKKGFKCEFVVTLPLESLICNTKSLYGSLNSDINNYIKKTQKQLEYFDKNTLETYIPQVKLSPDTIQLSDSNSLNQYIEFLNIPSQELPCIIDNSKISICFNYKALKAPSSSHQDIIDLFNHLCNKEITKITFFLYKSNANYLPTLQILLEQCLQNKGNYCFNTQHMKRFDIKTIDSNKNKELIFDIEDFKYDKTLKETFLSLIKDSRVTQITIPTDKNNILSNLKGEILVALKQRSVPLESFAVEGKVLTHTLKNLCEHTNDNVLYSSR